MKPLITTVSMASITPIVEQIIENGGEVRLTVTGQSMYPVFRHGLDSVVLSKPFIRPLKKYDIPLYKRKNGQYVLHRIVRIKGNELFLNGDSQRTVEDSVFQHQVIAVVKGFYRGVQYCSCENFFYKLFVWIWVAGLPIRGWMLWGYRRLSKIISKFKRRRTGKEL